LTTPTIRLALPYRPSEDLTTFIYSDHYFVVKAPETVGYVSLNKPGVLSETRAITPLTCGDAGSEPSFR